MKKFLLLSISSLVLVACNPEETIPKDLEKPSISLVRLNGNTVSDTAEQVLVFGHNDLEITFTDNVELSEANVNIHFSDGEHSHDENALIQASEAVVIETPFSYGPEIVSLSGKSSTKTLHLEVPDSASMGDYHLEISVLDKSANQTTEIYKIELGETHND